MFSTSIGRVARSSAASSCHNSLIARCPATAASTQLTAVSARQSDRSHQRRHSSSKASIPPDGNKRTPSKEREVAGASSGRVGRRKSKSDAGLVGLSNNRGRSQPFSKQYPNLPIVPSTQHLHPSGMSSRVYRPHYPDCQITNCTQTSRYHPSSHATAPSLSLPPYPLLRLRSRSTQSLSRG